MRCGAEVSLIGHTGQSDDNHSPDECASIVVRWMSPVSLLRAVVCTVAISCRPRLLRTISRPLDNGAYRKVRWSSRNGEPIAPIRDFSGLVSSICALARAAAIVPIVSLERYMLCLRVGNLEAHCPRARALGPDPMTDGFFGVLWHQAFQLGLRAFVLQVG